MPYEVTDRSPIAVLMPHGGLQLAWKTADGTVCKSRKLIQDEH